MQDEGYPVVKIVAGLGLHRFRFRDRRSGGSPFYSCTCTAIWLIVYGNISVRQTYHVGDRAADPTAVVVLQSAPHAGWRGSH